jgi:hypothetical protein
MKFTKRYRFRRILEVKLNAISITWLKEFADDYNAKSDGLIEIGWILLWKSSFRFAVYMEITCAEMDEKVMYQHIDLYVSLNIP